MQQLFDYMNVYITSEETRQINNITKKKMNNDICNVESSTL